MDAQQLHGPYAAYYVGSASNEMAVVGAHVPVSWLCLSIYM